MAYRLTAAAALAAGMTDVAASMVRLGSALAPVTGVAGVLGVTAFTPGKMSMAAGAAKDSTLAGGCWASTSTFPATEWRQM